MFYVLNGYRFEYDTEIRAILKQLGTDQTTIDKAETIEYLQSHTTEIDLGDEIEQWREDLIQYGLSELTDDSEDSNG